MTQIPQLPPHIDVEDGDLLVVRQSDNKDHKVPVSALSKGNVRYVQTIDDLRAVNGMQEGQAVEIVSTGRAGLFVWNPGNLSAECAGDPLMGIYVPPTGQSGSQGAWVRLTDGVTYMASWWGVSAASTAIENASAIQAAIGSMQDGMTLDFSGLSVLSEPVIVDKGIVLRGGSLLASGLSAGGQLVLVSGAGARIDSVTVQIGSGLYAASACAIRVVADDVVIDLRNEVCRDQSKLDRFIVVENSSRVSIANLYHVGIETLAEWEIGQRRPAVFFTGCTGCTLVGSESHSSTCLVELYSCSDVEISDSRHYGIFDADPETESALQATCSVLIQKLGGNRVINCYSYNSGHGFLIGQDSTNNTFTSCVAISAKGAAFYNSSGFYNSFVGCIADGARGTGFTIRGSYHALTACVARRCASGFRISGNGAPDALGYNGRGTVMTGCVAKDCDLVGLSFISQDGYFPRNFTAVGCQIIDCSNDSTLPPVLMNPGEGHKFVDGFVEGGNFQYGILVAGNVNNAAVSFNVSNNHIRSGTTSSIRATYSVGGVFSGNTFSDSGQTGAVITLAQSEKNSLTGNISTSVPRPVVSASSGNGNSQNVITGNLSGAVFGGADVNYSDMNIPQSYAASVDSAPKFVGQTALVGGVFYKAKGTASAADWVALN